MKKLLLLDADVIIDLHIFGLFEKMAKAYEIKVTKEVLREAKYYPKGNSKVAINIKDKVTVIEDVDVSCIKLVAEEAFEAMLTIDPGETESIAFIIHSQEDIDFCTCDEAAIKLLSYINLEKKAVSVETTLKRAGHSRKLFPRHLEKKFRKNIETGKALRVQYKSLV